MKQHLLTVSIVIPAHNEETTILQLLRALVNQKQLGYKLDVIEVICDGCTDKTEELARQFAKKHPEILIQNDGKRKGKALRLNNFYQSTNSDITVNLDADVKITDKFLISKLIKPFKDSNVGLVGGRNIPTKGTTFVQTALAKYDLIWRSITEQIREGHNVHNNPGCISAIRTSVIKGTKLPKKLVADDHYMYFFVTQRKHLFRFAKNAIVYYQVPSTLHDFLLQTSRFFASANDIEGYFGQAVEVEYAVPRSLKIRMYLTNLVRDPFWMIASLSLQLIQRVSMPLLQSKNDKHVWQQIRSSKQYV